MSFVTQTPSVDIIMGPMFSGKTTELHRRLNICADADLRVIYINSDIDVRADVLSTHNITLKQNSRIKYTKTKLLKDMEEECEHYDIIGVDEAQFFPDLVEFCQKICETRGKKVIVCGLNCTFKREVFGQLIFLIPLCDSITKMDSFCSLCRKSKNAMVPALFSKRIIDSDSTILVGGAGQYIPVCRSCFLKA
jgi:thymidine kinase